MGGGIGLHHSSDIFGKVSPATKKSIFSTHKIEKTIKGNLMTIFFPGLRTGKGYRPLPLLKPNSGQNRDDSYSGVAIGEP
jgi:hypothetical protein